VYVSLSMQQVNPQALLPGCATRVSLQKVV
jgi:hypothetical protein